MDNKEWQSRRSTEVAFVPKTDAKLRRLAAALDGTATILSLIESGKIEKEEVLKIQRILETNGYSKGDMFHLPYSFVNRILGNSEG
jgi:hypothetical protein